jgi:hypothetical protein
VVQNAKTTEFAGEDGLCPKQGAPKVEKCGFPRENSTRYGFTPLKRPGFSLKRSQTMSKTSGTMLKNSETNRKSTKATMRASP